MVTGADITCTFMNTQASTPSVTTDLKDSGGQSITVGATVLYGTVVHDTALVTSAHPIPAGSTLTFNLYNNGACTGGVADTEQFTLASPTTSWALVGTHTFATTFGSYCYLAQFVSSDPNIVASGNASNEYFSSTYSNDLTIAKSDSSATYVPGGSNLTYTLTVTNLGPTVSGPFTVSDVIPTNMTFVSSVPAIGSGCSYDGPSHTVTCTGSAGLAVNGQAPFTITVSTTTNSGCLVNSATVASAYDTSPNANNTATDKDGWIDTSVHPTGLTLTSSGFPSISGSNLTGLTYTASTSTPGAGLFHVVATPSLIRLSSVSSLVVTSGSLTVDVLVSNANGALIGGASSGADLTLTGTVTGYGNVLLTGKVVKFGSRELGTIDRFDLAFVVTGGSLTQFIGKDIGLAITAESSTFTGSFTGDFRSGAKFTIVPVTQSCPVI